MFEQDQKSERTLLVGELEGALAKLESALTEASRAIVVIRGSIPQISALAQVVTTMESAMTFARERLGAPQPAETPPLRTVPPQETFQPAPAPEATTPAPAAETAAPAQYCLRLRVGSKIGSLDLKAVDSAVNEQTAVTDVALIDYDGRQATLRVWIGGPEDAEITRKSLQNSLRKRLGDEDAAEIDIEFDERAAA